MGGGVDDGARLKHKHSMVSPYTLPNTVLKLTAPGQRPYTSLCRSQNMVIDNRRMVDVSVDERFNSCG